MKVMAVNERKNLPLNEGEGGKVSARAKHVVRKEVDKSWNERLELAKLEVDNGMSLRCASQLFAIGAITIRKHLIASEGIESTSAGTGGRHMWLPGKMEKELLDWCHLMGKTRYPATKKSLLKEVQRLLNRKKLHVFPNDNLPSAGWKCRFWSRHRNTAESLPDGREFRSDYKNVNILRKVLKSFFGALKENLEGEGLTVEEFLSHENASRVFSCDETGIVSADGSSFNALIKRRSQEASVSGENKLIGSVMCCASAFGDFMKPFLVNMNRSKHDSLSFNVGYSDSGWMSVELYHYWFVNIFNRELTAMNIRRPVLLIIDGHSTHLSLETLRFAQENKILIFYLPYNTAHILQPLDVAVFKPLKECCGGISLTNFARKDFFGAFLQATGLSSVSENVVNGFQVTGFVPFNPSAVKVHRYDTDDYQEVVLPIANLPAISDELQERSVEMSVSSPEDVFNKGYLEGQRVALQLLESVFPKDELALYRSRKTDAGWIDYPGLEYKSWRELQNFHSCPSEKNPYSTVYQPPTKVLSGIQESFTTGMVVDEDSNFTAGSCSGSEDRPLVSTLDQCYKALKPAAGKQIIPKASNSGSHNDYMLPEEVLLNTDNESGTMEDCGIGSKILLVAGSDDEYVKVTDIATENDEDDNGVGETLEDTGDDEKCWKCHGRNGDESLWVGCEMCDKWFHKSCVGVSLELSDEELEDLDFVCSYCTE